jgi:hypothetical protein
MISDPGQAVAAGTDAQNDVDTVLVLSAAMAARAGLRQRWSRMVR